MSQIPPEAMRSLVQASAEISVAVDSSPAGEALKASIEALMEALDAYRRSSSGAA